MRITIEMRQKGSQIRIQNSQSQRTLFKYVVFESILKPKKKSEIEEIDDEQEIYRYHQEQQYPLEPDLLLQLPNLQEQLIDKINKYMKRMQKKKEKGKGILQQYVKEQYELIQQQSILASKFKLQGIQS